MPILIDGHNLIPHVPGLNLQRLDDELELIKRLQTFCRVTRQSVEVYFDQAAPGQAGVKNFGMVKAHFVSQQTNADTAIRLRLQRLDRQARNWRVVSSDRQVQAEARGARARVVTSEEFAAQLAEAQVRAMKSPADGEGLTPEEVDYWKKIFNEGSDPAEK